jgi:hypothetical protein
VTVRRTHQPAVGSSTVVVTVTWQPGVTLTATPVVHEDDTQWLQLAGAVTDGPEDPVVDLQSIPAGGSTWSTVATYTPELGSFSAEVPRTPRAYYRAVLRPTSATPEVESVPVDSEAAPLALTLGHTVGVSLTPYVQTGTLLVDLTQGQRVTLAVHDSPADEGWNSSVVAPDLVEVATLGSHCACDGAYHATRFTAPLTGTYRIQVSTGENWLDLDFTASVPVHVQLDQDGPAEPYASSVQGQEVAATFHADAGDAFSVVVPGSPDLAWRMLEPDGTELTALVPQDHSHGYDAIYLADQTGTYTLRNSPSTTVGTGSVQVVHAAQTTIAVDGDPASIQVVAPGRVSLVWADLEAGDVVNLDHDAGTVSAQVLSGTSGQGYLPEVVGEAGERLVVVRCCTTDQTGPVRVKAGSPVELTGDVDGDPAAYDLTAWLRRGVDMTFTGTAGQAVDPVSDASRGSWTLYDPQGSVIRSISGAYVLPADGTYVLRNFLTTYGPGAVGLRSVPVADVPTDGTPTTLTLVQGDGVALGKITAPPGTPIDATLSDVDDSLAKAYYVYIEDSLGRGIRFWTEAQLDFNVPPDTRPTFTVPSDGIVYFGLLSVDNTSGSVKVSAVVHPS